MNDTLHLSQYRLNAFETCQRKFQLTAVSRLAWPSAPPDAALAAAFARGEQFHRLLEQHFVGMPVAIDAALDPDVRRWWRAFHADPPAVPGRDAFPEVSLTTPIGAHFLFGRFDLLTLTADGAHIFDWKTERKPRPAHQLRDAWQTRLYLAMLAKGAEAFGRTFAPEQIALTYWFANAPQQSVTLRYDSTWHQRNWAELTALVERLDRRLDASDAIWPLTDELSHCAKCPYRAYCGRQTTPVVPDVSEWEAAVEELTADIALEPDTP